MSPGPALDPTRLPDSQASALLFVLDPHGFGGIGVRAPAGPLRDRWLDGLRALMPAGVPWRRLPTGMSDLRLDDTLDLAATLALGRPLMQPGLLRASAGGVIVVPMAERLPEPVAARLAAALDQPPEGGGATRTGFGIVALDEGVEDEAVTPRLRDRLAFWTDLTDHDILPATPDVQEALIAARARALAVTTPPAVQRALVETAAAFGVDSIRPLVLAQAAARAVAALAARAVVTAADAGLAARLVLAPRATRVPAAPETTNAQHTRQQGDASRPPTPQDDASTPAQKLPDDALGDVVMAAVTAALPPGLLLKLQADRSRTARQAPGRAGAVQVAPRRGRPVGIRRQGGRDTARLHVIETLRAAAPWQRLRQPAGTPPDGRPSVRIHRDDFRFIRFKQNTETVTLFAVDASGSLALHRLAEAKGAVELLLAECYIRRDQVALLAFRGTGAEMVLPPTRSLARAKRCLAGLAGGGATPLAAGIDAAVAAAAAVRRRGRTPVVVFLTDGRANIARDGSAGRSAAETDAQSAARAAAEAGFRILVVDAGLRPQPQARALATTMRATYVPLPRAEAGSLTAAVRAIAAT